MTMSVKPRVAVIVFPGTNRERDIESAFESVAGIRPVLVASTQEKLPQADVIVLPGGFSWGDYLRSGAIASRSPIMRSVREAHADGAYVLGICNGFQILTESGLLPGVLLPHGKFVCTHVNLRIENSGAREGGFFTSYQDKQVISIPVAHQEGCYEADERTLDMLEAEGRIACRYVSQDGEVLEHANPNGSRRGIAGIFDETRRIVGMMPHFENACFAHHSSCDGAALFEGIIRHLTLGNSSE